MAAGNVGYTDTRSFSGSLLGDIASAIKNRTKNAALMARQERAYAEEQAEKQDTSLSEAGIGKGYFFRRALGSTFGGDRIARTRGLFEKDPPMGRDPLGSIESRFRGGFDYGIETPDAPKAVTSSPSRSRGGTARPSTTAGGSGKDGVPTEKNPLQVTNTRLTVGMLSTFQRLERQLANITSFVGTGGGSPQAVYALENQKMLLGSVFSKTTNMINAISKSIGNQTDAIKKVAKDESNKLKQDAIDAASKSEESGAEGQNAKANNAIVKALNKAKQARSALSAPGSRLKDIFGPASGMAKGLRNPRAAMRLARMRAKRVFGKSLAKGVTGRAFGRVGKIIAKNTLKKAAAKTAIKGVGKMAIKKVPILGAVAGVAFGIERAMKGDWLGAIGEVASGTASIFPGVGTAISTGIDAALMAKDMNEAMNQETPAFNEGGVIKGDSWFDSRISKFENDKLKRDMGAKPLDMNFWREWWTLDLKFDKKNKNTIIDHVREGLDTYFFKNQGVKNFVDGLKFVFNKISSFLMNIPGNIGNWFRDRANDLTSGLRSLMGGGGYTGPTMTATGGTKVTQADISRGFGVVDGLGSGSKPGGHTGLDIAGPLFGKPGTPISFLPSGKVIDVGIIGDANDPGGENSGYGNFVVIKTDTGEIVKMGHLQSVNVSKGARVGKDENGNATVIGAVGYTGFTEPKGPAGTHLHLDLGTGYNPGTAYVSGLMDPMPVINDLIRGGGDVKVTGQRNRTTTRSLPPQGNNDIIIPLDHVPSHLSGKFPDDESKTSFEQSKATGAAGRERDHQDSAAAKLKAKLEAKGFRVSVIKPESFSSYQTYDAYIKGEAAKGTRILPLHFDAKVGQGGTGFLTRTRKGDSADAAFARPIQAALSRFQRANPELGNLGPSDTTANATVNAGALSPTALIELGAMVQWEEKYGRNFTSTSTFNTLIESVADAVAQGTPTRTQAAPIYTQQINTVPTTDQQKKDAIWNIYLKGLQ
jgi:murein DD-endopeptidase MepM/ murein hydrolase activator NlpD